MVQNVQFQYFSEEKERFPRQPSDFQVEYKKTRFIDVLANAGGPTRFADTTQIKILSETEAPMTINLVEYTKSPHTYDIPHMKTGDVVFVPEKANVSEKSWLKITEDRSIKIIGAVKTR